MNRKILPVLAGCCGRCRGRKSTMQCPAAASAMLPAEQHVLTYHFAMRVQLLTNPSALTAAPPTRKGKTNL